MAVIGQQNIFEFEAGARPIVNNTDFGGVVRKHVGNLGALLAGGRDVVETNTAGARSVEVLFCGFGAARLGSAHFIPYWLQILKNANYWQGTYSPKKYT